MQRNALRARLEERVDGARYYVRVVAPGVARARALYPRHQRERPRPRSARCEHAHEKLAGWAEGACRCWASSGQAVGAKDARRRAEQNGRHAAEPDARAAGLLESTEEEGLLEA
jgi:hypothetical protein